MGILLPPITDIGVPVIRVGGGAVTTGVEGNDIAGSARGVVLTALL